MLGRRGHRTTLQLGIMKAQVGKIDAHAWLERDGQIIVGGDERPGEWTKLPPLEQES
jgi:hypothetical protein